MDLKVCRMQSCAMRIDNLQYANWSEKIFRQMNEGGVHAVHVTIAYHETFRETVHNIERWNRWFGQFPDLIFHGLWAEDVRRAREIGRTAIFFGFQNCSPMEDDIGLIEILHALGGRFMQLTYNNQSLLAAGFQEHHDSGVTRMGREVIREMNRVGLVIDMSHSGERSTIEAADLSERPIAITHANPARWWPVPRNKSDDAIRAVTSNGGMIGFSLYPPHLKDGSECSLESFCRMVAETGERFGMDRIGIGSDLVQDQPDRVIAWMRTGRWTKDDGGNAAVPPFPSWFTSNLCFGAIEEGLAAVGMTAGEIAGVMGGNWYRFYEEGFAPRPS